MKRASRRTAERALRRMAELRLTESPSATPTSIVDAVEALHELRVHQLELEIQNEELVQARAATETALANFAHLYDFAPVGYFTLQRDGTIVRTNLAGATLIGETRSALLQRRFTRFVDDASVPAFASYLDDVFSSYSRHLCVITLRATEKRPALVTRVEAISDERRQECRLVVTDITESKKLEERLKLAASVFTHAQEGIMIMDADGNIIEANHSFSSITGHKRDEVVGKNARILGSGFQPDDFYAQMWADLKAKGHWYGEIWDRRDDAELYAAMLRINAVPNAQGKVEHYVALLSDITTLKEHQNKLERLAHYDALTGLPNRVLLRDRLEHARAQTRRRENFMALVYLDLDGFKAVNDTHGHETGDELLVVVAQRLKDALREGDTLARLGGDEFVAVLADLSSTAECKVILTRLLQAAAAPVQIKGKVLTVSASLGVTLSPQDSGDADGLMRHADQAMYQAKQEGKNRFHIFDPSLDLHARLQRETLQHITQALAHGEFLLHFQPKINMRSGKIVGAEALIRWQHPERGLVLPDDFLPLAENEEVISHIGDWVIDTALDQIATWQRQGIVLPVSVNIAANHLQRDDFLTRLRAKLGEHPEVRPQQLELEVLESVALADINHISKVISGCQALGVNCAIDDFGTGYSSLTYLKRLPATTLKIDKSFVRDMLWDKEDLAIVEGVIGLAQAFGRDVVGEGAETSDHTRLLLRLGCDIAQGVGISQPLAAAAIAPWLERWRPDPQWSIFRDLQVNRDTLPLVFAEVEHRRLVRRIESFPIDGVDTPPAAGASSAANCQFARWYAHAASGRFGNLAEFRIIASIHDRLHALGDKLLLAQSLGRSGEVTARLDELHLLRDDLIDHLHLLSAAIGRSIPQSLLLETAS